MNATQSNPQHQLHNRTVQNLPRRRGDPISVRSRELFVENLPNSGPHLRRSSNTYDNFTPQTSVVYCFIECESRVMILQRPETTRVQPSTWGVPIGKIKPTDRNKEAAFARTIQKALQIEINEPQYIGEYYARAPVWSGHHDYILHIYRQVLTTRPQITLSKRYVDAQWVPIPFFKKFSSLNDQRDAFNAVYGDCLWERMYNPISPALQFINNRESIVFDNQQRLIISLTGVTGSGKSTQSALLNQWLALPVISIDHIFANEIHTHANPNETTVNCPNHNAAILSSDLIPIEAISQKLNNRQNMSGCILDGFPRSKKQTAWLERVFLQPDDLYISIFINAASEGQKIVEESRGINSYYLLDLTGNESSLSVFLLISSLISKKFNEIYSLETETEDAQTHKPATQNTWCHVI